MIDALLFILCCFNLAIMFYYTGYKTKENQSAINDLSREVDRLRSELFIRKTKD